MVIAETLIESFKRRKQRIGKMPPLPLSLNSELVV